MDKNKSKVIGVLGGMGPYATASFFKTLLDLTPAKKDWDHLHIVIDNNPHIPSRSRYHLFGEISPISELIASCKKLEAYPVDFIVIPCNSASYFIKEISSAITIPILNIMEITADALRGKLPPGSLIAVLGGIITYDHRTYKTYLERNGFSYLHHSTKIQRDVEKLIEKIKINANVNVIMSDYESIIKHMKQEYPIDGIILGCTEFDILPNSDCEIPIISSSQELAKYSIKYAKK